MRPSIIDPGESWELDLDTRLAVTLESYRCAAQLVAAQKPDGTYSELVDEVVEYAGRIERSIKDRLLAIAGQPFHEWIGADAEVISMAEGH